MLAVRLRLLLACLWAGSLWAVAYLVAPTLFATLHDNTLAGAMVGSLLRSVAWLSIACALVLLVLVWRAVDLDAAQRRGLIRLISAMLLCCLVIYLGIQPAMANLRDAAGPGGLKGSPLAARFGMLHGVSQLVYLVESVLAGCLVVKAVPGRTPERVSGVS
ncbi:MAG: DUF4149 domain-containing protein [Massilia sp.]